MQHRNSGRVAHLVDAPYRCIPMPEVADGAAAHNKGVRILYFLADMFIDTFGITRPTPKARAQAAFFILALMVITLVSVLIAGLMIHSVMSE